MEQIKKKPSKPTFKDKIKSLFKDFSSWLSAEDIKQRLKKIPSKQQVDEANKKFKKQIFFKTLQNPEYGINYYHEQFDGKQTPTLYVNGLTKFYSKTKKPTIQNISLTVKPGQFHAFIGSNGSGKTTTIKSIVGAYSNWNGTIMINGIPNTDSKSKQYLGYFPEKAIFPDGFTTYAYLIWMAKMNGQIEHDAIVTVTKIMKELGIVDIGHRNPNSFSSGQKKKVLLAQSLLSNPSILIMDEPTAMLDPGARKDLFGQLERLRKQGKSIFISSHVLAELEQYADSVTIIDKGRLIFSGDIKDVNQKIVPNLYVANTSATTKLKTFCTHNKLYCTSINNNFCIQINDEKTKSHVLQFIAQHKIALKDFYLYKPALEDIYDKLLKISRSKGGG